MRFSKIVRMFKHGNVAVCGLRGRGKDMLMANVVVRRRKPYISNVDYGGKFNELDFSAIDCGKNTYNDFISGTLKPYTFPYPDGTDVYISDVGVYLPAQYCNELNKRYPYLPVFMALSRHLGKCNVHYNVQALPRAWDKLREQVDQYIDCRSCICLFGKIVIQRIRIYERYESCVNHVPPLRVGFHIKPDMTSEILQANYLASHGVIKSKWLFYINRSKYDTRRFKTLLEGGSSST